MNSDTISDSKPSMIIKPKKNWFDFNFTELWNYRDLILLFVRRDFVSKYKQTILGPLWFLIQPLLTTVMFVIVFGKIAKISTDGLPQVLFYFSGLTAWNYFAESLRATSNTFVTNASVFGKVYFPRLTIPISAVLSNLMLFAIQFIFLVILLIYYATHGTQINLNYYLFLLPLLLVMMAGLGLGFGIIISSLTTKYRDLNHLVAFGIQLWMYATPVIFPLSSLEKKYKTIIALNPLTSVVETFRNILTGNAVPEFTYLAYSFVFMLIVLMLGVILFNRVEQSFMDTV